MGLNLSNNFNFVFLLDNYNLVPRAFALGLVRRTGWYLVFTDSRSVSQY